MKLLVVDDSTVIRNKIAVSAKFHRITEIVTANNGKQAVDVFRKEKPQLVTMDITMPEMNGVDCVHELIKIDPKVLILVVSALADKDTAIEALARGAHGFLLKPFSDLDLKNALTELIQGARGA